MEVDMIANLKWLMPLVVVGLPLTASAQISDATYCRRLIARYEALVENMNGHSMQPGGLDGQVAVEQCKEGNTAAGIPILERKLNDAKVALPKHS
jgi:anti-sigma factor ChrR (cupin superfamily)